MRMCGIEQLVSAALVGYNVTVLVYGQTGSGKTFTISGREEAPDEDGYGGEPVSNTRLCLSKLEGMRRGWVGCVPLRYKETLAEESRVGTVRSTTGVRHRNQHHLHCVWQDASLSTRGSQLP
jgi:hypothetical protein